MTMGAPASQTDTSPPPAGDAHVELSNAIGTLRMAGKLREAIAKCEEAKRRLPDDLFFYKILADLYFQQGNYEAAFVALADFLGQIPPSMRLIAEFANRYHRFRRVLPKDQMAHFAKQLDSSLDQANLNRQVAARAKAVIAPDLAAHVQPLIQSPEVAAFIVLLETPSRFAELAKQERKVEARGQGQVTQVLDQVVLNRERTVGLLTIDVYCASLYEKFNEPEKALKIIGEILQVRLDHVAIRALFRICRNKKNYDKVDELLARRPSILQATDFNVLYELVYYFEAKNDFDQLYRVLRILEKGFSGNLPVLRTLRNFYIRFGMLEDAKRIEPSTLKLFRQQGKASEKFVDQVVESETELASKVQDLYSQLEHQRQLAAISDLTKGISHELGQPITNIRYTLQFYRKLLDKNLTKEGVFSVFDSVLEETERMGALIRRLAPLTSSKSVTEQFDILDRIQKRLHAEHPRLSVSNIRVLISPQKPLYIYGDPIKFDQLISNLLLNSIDAIKERKKPGPDRIEIALEETAQEARIYFSDTGVGIPIANTKKIFDPFFSTKPPGKGEGLGLFIVWNLLKMQGGRISVDAQYKHGARFVITIPKRPPSNEE